jgi:hypothetical protein
MFPKFSVVVSHFRCQSPDGRHFAFNMGFFDNTEHGTCAELGEFSTHNPTHKMLDAVEVRSSSLLVPTIFLHHLASLTSLRKAPNGSIKRADPEGMMFRTSSNPTSGEFWAAHFYGTGVLRQIDSNRTLTGLSRRCPNTHGLVPTCPRLLQVMPEDVSPRDDQDEDHGS